MKIKQKNINDIRLRFLNLKSDDDLLELINDVAALIYPRPQKLVLEALLYLADTTSEYRFERIIIPKKNGQRRTIHAPYPAMNFVLKSINFILQYVDKPHKCAFGFVKNKSVADNARIHIQSKYVYNTDLKNFFHAFDGTMVYKFLSNKLGLSLEISDLLSQLITHEIKTIDASLIFSHNLFSINNNNEKQPISTLWGLS